MLLLDIDVINSSPGGLVLISERLAQGGVTGVVVYDKFSDEDSIINPPGTDNTEPDHEDYVVWRFATREALIPTKEITQIFFTPDVNDSLGGTYFGISAPGPVQGDPDIDYYVWFDTGASTDPAPGTGIGIQVIIAINDTAATIAGLVAAALTANIDFVATALGNSVRVESARPGDVCNAVDFTAGIVANSFTEGGDSLVALAIANENIYPKLRPPIPDYTVLRPLQFNIMTELEWKVVQSVLHRIDIVRRRYPNLGDRVLGMGFSGGFEKKFTIEEILDYVYQTLIELNVHPPITKAWFTFMTESNATARAGNPYNMFQTGVPLEYCELLVTGAMIKALLARQIFEIDTNFNITDAGISISYDRQGALGSVISGMLSDYESKKKKLKWATAAPHGGSGLGTFFGFGGHPIYASVLNSISTRGTVSLRSLSPFFSGGRIS